MKVTPERMSIMAFLWLRPNRFFSCPLLVLPDARHNETAPRFHALGKTIEGWRLHITFTLRDADQFIRVISARDMHRKERVIYEQAT
jgi:uncharacterized DUF497 family protein